MLPLPLSEFPPMPGDLLSSPLVPYPLQLLNLLLLPLLLSLRLLSPALHDDIFALFASAFKVGHLLLGGLLLE